MLVTIASRVRAVKEKLGIPIGRRQCGVAVVVLLLLYYYHCYYCYYFRCSSGRPRRRRVNSGSTGNSSRCRNRSSIIVMVHPARTLLRASLLHSPHLFVLCALASGMLTPGTH